MTTATGRVKQLGRRPFRLALVGTGRMGSTHARSLAGCPGVELAAVVEPSEAAARQVPGQAPRFRCVGEMLAGGRPDGALVAVPSRLHVEVVLPLLAAGVPVLCEKPLGLTADEAEHLGCLAQVSGVLLRVGYWRRFVPELRVLRERIAAGELGEVQFVFCAQWDERPPPPSFRDPTSSGGILVDMGVHELDAIRWLTGQEVVDASGFAAAVTSELPVPGDPESVSVAIRLSGGATALITLIRRHVPGDVVRLEVVGTEDAVRLEPLAPPDGEERLLEALRAQLEDFVSVARGGPSNGATAADAVAALQAVERIREVVL